jgi:hypothetical protein
MKTNTGQTGYKKAGRLLQDGAALVSVEEYAAKEGVSTELIEACALAGVVQTRRHKGKTFVVDHPLTPYSQASPDSSAVFSAGAAASPQPAAYPTKSEQHRENKVEKVKPAYPPKANSNGLNGQTIAAGSIANLAKKMFLNAQQLSSKFAELPAVSLSNPPAVNGPAPGSGTIGKRAEPAEPLAANPA